MKDRVLKFMKESGYFVFLFPVIMVYVFCPVMFSSPISGEMEFAIEMAVFMMATWWIVAYYDGKLKTAAVWLVRYFYMLLPIWIVYYVIYMNTDWGFVPLYNLVQALFINTVMGTAAFCIKKIFRETMVVFVFLLIVYIFLVAPPELTWRLGG